MPAEAPGVGDAPGRAELGATLEATPVWPAPLRGARAAFVFFSRLPVGGFPYRAIDWHWAPAHLPLVGAVVGAGSAAVFALGAWLGLGPLLASCLALAASLWLTGGLHEDGLADSADGLGGGSDRERVLAIMKGSRIGTYGAAALFLALLARVAGQSELSASAWFAIISVHVSARVAPVWLICALPYVNDRNDAKSQGLFQTRPLHVGVALGWSLLVAALGVAAGWLPWSVALAATLAPLALVPLLAAYFRRRLGGVTGDLLGAAEQIAEVVAWVAVIAALSARAEVSSPGARRACPSAEARRGWMCRGTLEHAFGEDRGAQALRRAPRVGAAEADPMAAASCCQPCSVSARCA